MKKLCIIIAITLNIFNIMCVADEEVNFFIDPNEVEEVQLCCTHDMPCWGGIYYDMYMKGLKSTSNKNEIEYITHLISSIEVGHSIVNETDFYIGFTISIVLKDGKMHQFYIVSDYEGSYFNLYETTELGENNKYSIVSGGRELRDFISGFYLETAADTMKNTPIPEINTYEPSVWAAEAVNASIESGIIPKSYRINYQNPIFNCEIDGIIYNFLNVNGFAEDLNVYINEYVKKEIDLYGIFYYKFVKRPYGIALEHLGIGGSSLEYLLYQSRGYFAESLYRTYLYMSGVRFPRHDDNGKINNPTKKEAIDFLIESGIMNGYENGEFNEEKYITKEEVIVALNRLALYWKAQNDET